MVMDAPPPPPPSPWLLLLLFLLLAHIQEEGSVEVVVLLQCHPTWFGHRVITWLQGLPYQQLRLLHLDI